MSGFGWSIFGQSHEIFYDGVGPSGQPGASSIASLKRKGPQNQPERTLLMMFESSIMFGK